MSKSPSAATEIPDQSGILKTFVPVQEGLDRLHQAADKLSSTYSEVTAHQMAFLQRTVFDALTEFQGLSHARNPAELYELGAKFAWQQTERSLKALTDLGNEMSGCWFEALKSAPEAKAPKSGAVH